MKKKIQQQKYINIKCMWCVLAAHRIVLWFSFCFCTSFHCGLIKNRLHIHGKHVIIEFCQIAEKYYSHCRHKAHCFCKVKQIHSIKVVMENGECYQPRILYQSGRQKMNTNLKGGREEHLYFDVICIKLTTRKGRMTKNHKNVTPIVQYYKRHKKT